MKPLEILNGMDEQYTRGFIDCLQSISYTVNGVLCVGPDEIPLDSAIEKLHDNLYYCPPSLIAEQLDMGQ